MKIISLVIEVLQTILKHAFSFTLETLASVIWMIHALNGVSGNSDGFVPLYQHFTESLSCPVNFVSFLFLSSFT